MILNNKELKILTEFTSDYNSKRYGRAIAAELKMNQKTVSNILNMLERQNIIKFKREGKNKYYFLNKLNPSTKEMIKLVEINKRIVLFEKYKKLNSLFLEIEKRTNGIIIIFGSYANSTKNERSDLDVFIIGNISDIDDLETLYNIKINVVKSTKDKFKSNDLFLKEIMNNHILLKGVEEFIDLTW
ncbi:MAG: nucleotidyltransferase domain-containing protein [Nanoarchaeota archaeon]